MAYQMECSEVIPECDRTLSGETREDTIEEFERHAKKAHDLAELPSDLTEKVLVSIHPTNG